ncbi:unnamed protein product [Leptidea sinapis]|uniref:Uncharacterized protein n=1 Tax=Leptidea sinapis TaxID=189913 RepID=A0A5E4QL37_9NEOP|nr:unnamed protein product [Leptidea sinapis]
MGRERGDDGILRPVTTNDPVEIDSILNTIFCRCTTGSWVRCGCQKAEIAYSSVYGVRRLIFMIESQNILVAPKRLVSLAM